MRSKHTRKKRTKPKLPHSGVYTRLRPSKVHGGGVGVFAIRKIPKGTHIFRGDEETKLTETTKSSLRVVAPELRKLYEDFCIIEDRGETYRCPTNFNLMTISWYLNEPAPGNKANVRCGRNDLFYALRDIKAGEELTVDYKTYNEFE